MFLVQEKRVVTKKGSGGVSPKGPQEQGDGGSCIFSLGRGKRRQLLVTTPGNSKASFEEYMYNMSLTDGFCFYEGKYKIRMP